MKRLFGVFAVCVVATVVFGQAQTWLRPVQVDDQNRIVGRDDFIAANQLVDSTSATNTFSGSIVVQGYSSINSIKMGAGALSIDNLNPILDIAEGELRNTSTPTLDWISKSLENGAWTVATDATNGQQIVNYQTMTNYTRTASVLSATNNVIYGGSDTNGLGGGFQYFAIGGLDETAQQAEGAWRMGIVDGNMKVQVMYNGGWSNAVMFTRP